MISLALTGERVMADSGWFRTDLYCFAERHLGQPGNGEMGTSPGKHPRVRAKKPKTCYRRTGFRPARMRARNARSVGGRELGIGHSGLVAFRRSGELRPMLVGRVDETHADGAGRLQAGGEFGLAAVGRDRAASIGSALGHYSPAS